MKTKFLLVFSIIAALLFGCIACDEQPLVTEDQRAHYFDFARTYRIDKIPNFNENEPLYAEDLKWYAYALSPEKGNTISAAAMQSAAAYFKNAEIPKDATSFPLEIGDIGGKPFLELISCSKKIVDNRMRIVIEMKNHHFYPLDLLEDQEGFELQFNPVDEYSPNVLAIIRITQQEQCSYYEAARKLVISNDEKAPERPSSIIRLEFETKDGNTPTAFISKSTRYWISETERYE